MKKLIVIAAVLAVLPFVHGCTTGTASIVKALGQDTNSVVVDVTTVFGTAHITRNMPYPNK